MANPPAPPANSRINLVVATMATPLNSIASVLIALFLLLIGVAKLLPGSVAPPLPGTDVAGPQLLDLATGGVITTEWGRMLIGAVQALLGLGLLIPPARAIACLGCLAMAALVIVGGVIHRAELVSGNGLNTTGIALVVLAIILLCGAAFGARSAARRSGAAS